MARWTPRATRTVCDLTRGIACVALGIAALSSGCGSDTKEEPAAVTAVGSPSSAATPASVASHGIYVVGVVTREVKRLTDAPAHYFGPSWSPDGTKLAFSAGTDIVLTNVAGDESFQLTHNGRSNYLPVWSPTGREILFISQEGDNLSSAEIYRIDADGRNEERLTTNIAWEYRADWSPDGSQIMFGSERDSVWTIFTMGADGKGEAALTTPAAGNAIDWSPDGRLVLFTSDRDGDDDIYSMGPDGSAQRNLTNNSFHDDNASLSADGKRIAFSSDRSGKNEIYVMDLDGTNVRQLTFDATFIPNVPAWAPDGANIAFSATSTQAASQ